MCPLNDSRTPSGYGVNDLVDRLRITVQGKQGKNVQILHLAARICRKLRGKISSGHLYTQIQLEVHIGRGKNAFKKNELCALSHGGGPGSQVLAETFS